MGKRSWHTRAGALLLTALLLPGGAAPAAQAAPASRPRAASAPHPFAAGEALEYQGSWQGLDAASARLAVAGGSAPGTLRLSGQARTSAMVAAFLDFRLDSEVLCDARTLLPITVRRTTHEGGQPRIEQATFDHARGFVEVGGERRPIARDAHDPVTALYALRAMRFGRLGAVRRLALTDFGNPLTLDIEVLDRRDGRLSLRLVSTETRSPAQRSVLKVEMEEGGKRRLLRLVTVLPFGEVTLALKP